jgi:hypothetical protein
MFLRIESGPGQLQTLWHLVEHRGDSVWRLLLRLLRLLLRLWLLLLLLIIKGSSWHLRHLGQGVRLSLRLLAAFCAGSLLARGLSFDGHRSFAHRTLILIALNVHFLVIDVLRLQLLSIEYCGSLHLDNFCLLDDGRLSFHGLRGLVGQ